MSHPACVVAWVITVLYLGIATWLVRRAQRAATASQRLASQSLEQAALAKAQLEHVQQARRSLPLMILAVAVGYAYKAKN
jgi:hypothetical protein